MNDSVETKRSISVARSSGTWINSSPNPLIGASAPTAMASRENLERQIEAETAEMRAVCGCGGLG